MNLTTLDPKMIARLRLSGFLLVSDLRIRDVETGSIGTIKSDRCCADRFCFDDDKIFYYDRDGNAWLAADTDAVRKLIRELDAAQGGFPAPRLRRKALYPTDILKRLAQTSYLLESAKPISASRR